MANWKKSAQYILESNNYVQPAKKKDNTQSSQTIDLWRNNPNNKTNSTADGANSSDSWKSQVIEAIKSKSYINPESRTYELTASDGKNFGTVSFEAYRAIKNNELDSYTPKSTYEKNVINSFADHANKLMQERISSNPTFARYNIDPNNFDYNDLAKWANQHNQTLHINSSGGIDFSPKYKGGFFGIGGRKLSTDQEDKDMEVLYQLAGNNARKDFSHKDLGAFMSAIVGFGDGMSFGALDKLTDSAAEYRYKKSGLNPDDLVTPSQAWSKTVAEHSAANVGGNIVGSVASLSALNKGVSAATGAIKWLASTPQWVQSAINNGITFALASSAETASGGGSWQDVLKNAGINFVGGAAGGSLSSIVGDVGEKLISNTKLRNKIIPEIARNALSSAAFAGGKTASTYYLYPKDSRPTTEDITRDVATAFAFGSISSALNMMETSRQNKANLDVLKNAMAADYENMARASVVGKDGNTVVVDTENLAKNVIKYGDAIESYLNGKGFEIEVADYSGGTGMTAYGGKSTGAVPTKTITQAKGARFVGQEKYVKSILAEVQTIKNNAYDILNKAGAASASTAPTSTTPATAPTGSLSTAQPTATAAQSVPTASAPTVSAPPPVVSEPVINTPVAAPAAEPAVNINTAATVTAPTGNQTNSVNEEITKYTPETADNEIKKLEDNLIRYGTDDVSRKEVIDTAVDIENALVNSDRSVKEVFDDVSNITHDAVTEIKNKAGSTNAYWNLFGENLKAVKSGNVSENVDAVTEYSNTYADALLDNDSEKYNAIMTATDGSDISAQLPKTIMENIIPTNAKNPYEYRLAAAYIKNILNDVNVRVSAERDEVFTSNQAVGNDNAEDTATTGNTTIPENMPEQKSLHLTQVGDFYEAYGDEALEIADKLNLTPTTKVVDGKSVQMVGFPKQALKQYEGVLGNDYAITVKNQNEGIDELPEDVSSKIITDTESVAETPNNSAVPYTDKEKQNWKNSNTIIVYENNKQFEAFVRKVLNNEDTHKKIYFGKIPDTTAQMVFNKTGVDVSSHNITLKGYEIRKILLNSHGDKATEAARGQEPIAVEDLENIPSIIINPDNVNLSEKEYEGKPALLFEKTINGKNYVVAYVSRKHHDIAIQTMYKKRSLATAENANALSFTSKATSSTAPNNIVSQDNKNVNPENSDSKESSTQQAENVRTDMSKAAVGSQVLNTDNSPQPTSETPLNSSSASGDIVSQDNGIVNGAESNNAENATGLTDKCELIKTKHTVTGNDIWVVTLKDRITPEEYKDLSGKVKSVGGYYSRFAKTPEGKAIPGFIFKTEPTEKELSVFNEFFGDSKNILNNQPKDDTIKSKTDKDGAINDESQSTVLAEKGRNDDRGLHSGASGADVESRIEEANEPHRDNGGERLPQSVGDDGSRSDVGNDSKGIHRGNDEINAVSEAVGASAGNRGRGELLRGRDRTVQGIHREPEQLAESDVKAPETIDTEVKTVERKRPSNKENFIITNDVAAELDNTLPNAKDNLEAIDLLLKLESEGRSATADEKKILAKYKGWGGIDIQRLPWELSQKMNKLYSYEQHKAMQSSQNNAFFTPTKVIDEIYNGLKRMGFKGGNVLESSMGTGNFFGRMPPAISAKSKLTGIELEAYTARIAQYLYPGATVINMPFQDVAIRNGSYDLVIGNVPFGQNKISYNKKKYSLHNYFIISSLDKVRDGGIVAVITSAGTLDSHAIDARKAIMDRADVVACYKLPEKVFSRNAKTDVQSDLLILRKRAKGAKPVGDSILNTVDSASGIKLNEYFVKHPENVLGTLAKGTNAWGDITTVKDNGDFYDKLNSAMNKLPKDLISGKSELKPVEAIISVSDKPRFLEKNGKIYSDDGAGTATVVSKVQESTVRDYMTVRDAYKNLLSAYEQDLPEENIKPLRDVLSGAYDKFFKEHGVITGDGKKKIGNKKSKNNTFLEADSDYYLVSGLEKYNAKNASFEKSALFEKDTLRKKKVKSVDIASDALAVSLNESGRIDFDRMSELTGKSKTQLAEELKGEIVLTPEGDYILTDLYLSGNIYEKLDAVKNKPEFKAQKEMLQKVLPTPKGAADINVKLGANYIEPKYIEQFARDVLNSRLTIRKDVSGRWIIEGVRQSRYGDIVNVKYGCNAFNAVQLLEKVLNDGEITATKKVGTGKEAVTVPDLEMTDIARQKADDIRSAFDSWIFRDSDRRNDIVGKYNRMYNNYRPLDYNRIAEKLSFDSMDSVLKEKLYPHQKNGIARFLFDGNVLFAHGVGTGKTFEMIASVMEARRMGIVNKAAMVVPNNKVVDFKRDISQAYPNAKVLVIDTANKKRQTMLGLVNSNDWDIVLVAKPTFTKIPVSRQMQAHYVAQQLEDLQVQISEAESDRNVSKRQLKGLIAQRDNFEQKLKDLNSDTKRDENSIDFEKLGIDCICVDEAHNYKSIMTPTKLDIKGLVNRNNAQVANDMLMKLDYIRSIDGRIIFGTGTPITNTVSEIYNMMRMGRPDILESAGIHSLDEWVNTFAKIETTTEIGIDNQIKTKSTQIIKSFVNTSEMIGMFRQFADVVFTQDVVKNLPKAKYIDIEIPGTPEHKRVQNQVSKVIATTKKSELLKAYGQVMAMADAASVDLRMLSGAESEYNVFKNRTIDELEYENSKINKMCDIVFDEYTKSNNIKGTQIIFCDKGSGSGTVYSFNLHKDIMQKLISKGIPKDEIVIIKNQSDAQLESLYDKVNEGEVRVIIGTSQKMAEGLNVQKRVVAIHHPTVTYKPSDWEQGNARGVRAGNINNEVRIYRYLQENTFDSHKWQAQDRKSEMINKALRGEAVGEMEDIGADENGGAGIDAATAMAITSGNPLVKEKIDIDKEVTRLKTLKQNYMGEQYRYQDAIAKNPAKISQLSAYADNMNMDIAVKNKHGDKNAITVKGKNFEKQTEANKALAAAIKSAPKNGQYTKLGTFNGFDIMFKGDTGGMNYSVVLKSSNDYPVDYAENGNNIARFAGTLNRLDSELEKVNSRIEMLKTDLDFAKKEIMKPFKKEADLTSALDKQKDITYRYEHYGEKTGVTESAKSENTAPKGKDNTVRSSKDVPGADSENRWVTKPVKENTNSSVNIADIVADIRKKFGIPISAGKVTDREASGIYKEKAEAIRTRIANNLPTVSHELGHHLDKKYEFSRFESTKELCKEISSDFLNKYVEEEKASEAVAEFVRTYLKNTNEANRLCPDFYSDFISTLSKADLKAINEIASSVNEYLSYNVSDRYSAAIVSSAKNERLSFKEKWSELYTNWVDSFHPQKEAVDYVENITGKNLTGRNNAYKLATNSLNAHTIANFLICEGFRDSDGKIINAKSFIDSIAMVDSKNVKLLDKYLVLRHSLEWIAPTLKDVSKKRVFADDTLEDVDTIKEQMAEIEKEHPEIKTAAENLYEYQNNILKYFVIPAGGMTEDTLDSLNKKYPSYVPFYRAVGKKSGLAKGTFANQESPISRAKGSGALIISPTESIIRNTEKMVKFALRNQVMQTLAHYANTVDGFGQFMEKVPPDMIPHVINITAQKGSFENALKQVISTSDNYFEISDLFNEILGDTVTDFTPVASASKKIVTVMQNGKMSYYQIHDSALYESVAELSPKQVSGLLKISHMIMQPMKLLITQNNPIFAATNALRDLGTAYKLSAINNPVEFAVKYLKAFGGVITNSKDYKQYKAMGGGHSSELTANIEDISKTLHRVAQKDMGKARRLAYSIFLHPVDTVAALNDVVESTPRFMEFQRTLKKTGDLQEAIYNADDITTNFKRSGKGTTAKAVNKTIMFNNAAIQGLDKMFRTVTEKDTKKRVKTLIKWLIHALLIGAVEYIYNKQVDEEGYKNLSSYKKNNFYNFAIGDGKFITLPKPRENAILDTFTERMIEYSLDGDKEAFYDFGGYLGLQLLPPMIPDTLNPVDAVHSVGGSTIFGGLIDVGFNKDFKGAPIESEYDKDSPSNERYTESTTKLAYRLGQTKLARDNDMSPKKIDHLILSYTGILGQVNKALFPMSENRVDKTIGLRNKFVSDSNYSTDVLNKLYDNRDAAERNFKYYNTIEKAVEYEKNAVITSYISGMNKAIKALPYDKQRDGRILLLKDLNNWEYGNTKSQQKLLSQYKGDSVTTDYIITGVPKSELEWSDKKVKYSYQMTPAEYSQYVKDYLTLVENYRSVSKNIKADNLAETKREATKKLNEKYKKKFEKKAQKVKKK